jgi:HupE / UreJ protein
VTRRSLLLVAALALTLGVGQAARAHTRSTSYSSWEIEGREATVRFRIPQLELTRLPWGIVAAPRFAPELGRYLTDGLRLMAGGVPCPVVDGPRALSAPRDRALLEWHVRCPEQGALSIESDLLREVAPSHLHFARLRQPDGAIVERVLAGAERSWLLPGQGPPGAPGADDAGGSDISRYVAVGAEHIATGYDHLVFLLGLLLLASRVSEVVTIVTGFTLAHSITLGLAALGSVRPSAAAVQALIGLSIALVAAENGWLLAGRPRIVPRVVVALLVGVAGFAAAGFGSVPAVTSLGLALFAGCYFALVSRAQRPARLRFAIAFCFGLVHGFGFAGVLNDIALPQERLLPALLGFNAGVELGQLAIVALTWPVLAAVARLHTGQWHQRVLEIGSGVVCGLGVYWWIGRAFA